MTEYLTIIEVLAIHEDQIERYGGSHGLRDPGLLEAALYRPQTGYYEDIIAKAAALWESLSQNHPFIDGNKRTSFACAYTFLRINDLLINSPPDETYEFIFSHYEGDNFSFEELETWLRKNSISVT